MNRKITPDILINEYGFIHHPSLIQDSYEFILDNEGGEEMFSGESWSHYRAISLSECNDKGMREYYVFLKDGETDIKNEITTITRNMLYEKDLKDLLRILKL